MTSKFWMTVAVAISFMVSAASASTITGTELPGSSSFNAPSTNALNYAKLAPGHEGQLSPFVIFNSDAIGSVTLDFFGAYTGLAFFEIRIDGIQTGTTPHPVVAGDTIHTGGVGVNANLSTTRTFFANSRVEVRLALGAERDWDFDWTAFETAQVPLPASLPLLLAGIGGFVAVGRRRRRANA